MELSAKLLEYVKNYASGYLDEEITRAVISVPAYFNDRLIQWLVQQFLKKHEVDLRMNTYAMVKLKEKAEWCKKELSTQQSCQIVITLIAESGGNTRARKINSRRNREFSVCQKRKKNRAQRTLSLRKRQEV